MRHIGLIPRNRLSNIPPELRVRHEFCFFLHDQCVQILKEYEDAEAHFVTLDLQSSITAQQFQEILDAEDPITALRRTGFPNEARRVIINQVTMALAADLLHHLFEGLRCLEKRKVIVAMNLLRKPLKDNLLYLAWMLGDEDHFYNEFTKGDPERLTQQRLGNVRVNIISKAIARTRVGSLVDATLLNGLLYDRRNVHSGLEELFQHAVHLITIRHIELRTSPENFNFIFKNYEDDDIYYTIYSCIPYVLLFMSHVLASLFDRMRPMDRGSLDAFCLRSLYGFSLLEDVQSEWAHNLFESALRQSVTCRSCHSPLTVTRYNRIRILLTDSFRCTSCRRVNAFPFSWLV